MKHAGALGLVLLAAALAGCQDHRNNTAVLGGYGNGPAGEPSPPALTDAQGHVIPAPAVPPRTRITAVRSGDEQAIAAWIADHHVVAATWTPAGWSAPQPLERIYGESSDVQLASNGQGRAMAVWHHRVGNIHSLRFSRFDAASGWSLPDVVPGALPRPEVAGTPPGRDAPQLQMDAEGNVVARWPSGFHANEMQTARYAAGQGWSDAASEPVASATPASPAPPAPSSAR